eukprot:SAG11_NODE_6227_length_1358_cov_5.754567_2_plen_78_part_01
MRAVQFELVRACRLLGAGRTVRELCTPLVALPSAAELQQELREAMAAMKKAQAAAKKQPPPPPLPPPSEAAAAAAGRW